MLIIRVGGGGSTTVIEAPVELRDNGAGQMQWRLTEGDDVTWKNLKAWSALTGADGTNGTNGVTPDLQATETHIQYKYGEGEWTNLVALADITGPQGEQGEQGDEGPVPIRSLTYVIDGSGAAIPEGIVGDIRVPRTSTIKKVTLLADQDGDVEVDIWKDTYANYPPTVADSICASALPALSSASKYEDSTITGWTTSITAGDILRVSVVADSVATITRLTIIVDIE